MRINPAKAAAAALTVATLVVVYARVDITLLLHYLGNANPFYLLLALFMFLPQALVSGLRWRILTEGVRELTFSEAVQMNLAGKALNAVAPSNLGEISKAYFLKKGDEGVDAAQAVSAVLLEKTLDQWGLCAVLLLGAAASLDWRSPVIRTGLLAGGAVVAGVGCILLLRMQALCKPFARGKSTLLRKVAAFFGGWDALLSGLKARDPLLLKTLSLSFLVWALHVYQLYLFFPALGKAMPIAPALSRLPLAVLTGFLPITVGGMGTRDSALIFLFAPYADASFMAGVGLLCSLRYWIDTLMGVPFFHKLAGRSLSMNRNIEQGAYNLDAMHDLPEEDNAKS